MWTTSRTFFTLGARSRNREVRLGRRRIEWAFSCYEEFLRTQGRVEVWTKNRKIFSCQKFRRWCLPDFVCQKCNFSILSDVKFHVDSESVLTFLIWQENRDLLPKHWNRDGKTIFGNLPALCARYENLEDRFGIYVKFWPRKSIFTKIEETFGVWATPRSVFRKSES